MIRPSVIKRFSLLLILFLLPGCSDANNVTDCGIDNHIHNYEKNVIKEASCNNSGEYIFQCECGEEYREVIQKTDHCYGAWVIDIAPTEDTPGRLLRICDNDNGHTETMSLPQLNDCDYQYTITKAPGIEETGTGKYIISIDGQEFSFQTTISSTHRYDEGVIAKKATCDENGELLRTCEECGDTYLEIIPMLDHNYGEWSVKTEPTVFSTGELTAVCQTDTDHIGSFILPVLSVENGYTYECIISATSTTDGLARYTYTKDSQVFTFDTVIHSDETEFDPR